MLINCSRCAKTLSSKLEKCPFCKKVVSEMNGIIRDHKITKVSRFKSSINLILSRQFYKIQK